MKTLIRKGIDKILYLFYEEKAARIHLRAIARRTGLNENSAYRFLSELEKEKLLVSRKDGNLKKYETAKTAAVYSIFAYLDVARFGELPSLRKNALGYFLDHLKEKPIIALVFGSTAKRTFKEDSDIDLLLIVNRKIDTKAAKEYADSQTTIRISCTQITVEEFKKELKLKEDKVVQSAINTGYPVTNNVEYYRMINSE